MTLVTSYTIFLRPVLFLPNAAPSAPPQQVHVEVINSRTVYLTWEPPAAENQNGIIREYLIKVTTSDGTNQQQYMSSSSSLSVADLHPHYTYIVTVAAVTVNTGPFTDEYSVTMPEDG